MMFATEFHAAVREIEPAATNTRYGCFLTECYSRYCTPIQAAAMVTLRELRSGAALSADEFDALAPDRLHRMPA